MDNTLLIHLLNITPDKIYFISLRPLYYLHKIYISVVKTYINIRLNQGLDYKIKASLVNQAEYPAEYSSKLAHLQY